MFFDVFKNIGGRVASLQLDQTFDGPEEARDLGVVGAHALPLVGQPRAAVGAFDC